MKIACSIWGRFQKKDGKDTRSEFVTIDGNVSARPYSAVVQLEKEQTETQRRIWASTIPIVDNNKSHR